MKGKISLIFLILFFSAFFILLAQAQEETFISAEKLQNTPCSSSEGYSIGSQFFDGNSGEVYLCVKRETFDRTKTYVTESYFEISGDTCTGQNENLMDVGAFNDVNENRVLLCRKTGSFENTASLIKDIKVIVYDMNAEDTGKNCPPEYAQVGEAINVGGGRQIKHCVHFADPSRRNRDIGCSEFEGALENFPVQCKYRINRVGEIGTESKAILESSSPSTCDINELSCVCQGMNVYPQYSGWVCSATGGSDGGSDDGETEEGGGCTDTDGSPSNTEEIANSNSIFTQGEVETVQAGTGSSEKLIDSCDNEILLEAYCDANGVGQIKSLTCPEEKSCFSGKCINPNEFSDACIIYDAMWADSSLNEIDTAIGQVKVTQEMENAESVQPADNVILLVRGNSVKCVGKTIEFKIYENDLFLLDDDDHIKTLTGKITSDGFAIVGDKLAWFNDIGTIGDKYGIVINPEIYFKANIKGENRKISSGKLLLLKPQITSHDYSNAEVLWESYNKNSAFKICPRDTFLVGIGNDYKRHCAELKRVSDGMKVIWKGNPREIPQTKDCLETESSLGVVNKKRNCIKMKLSNSKDKVVLDGVREISYPNDCRRSEVIIKSKSKKTYCALVSIEEAAEQSKRKNFIQALFDAIRKAGDAVGGIVSGVIGWIFKIF